MVSIFAREITDDLASLVKQIDDSVAQNEDKKMAAFVVLLTDDQAGGEAKLKKLAEKHNIANTPLTVFSDTKGPGNYRISPKADVTVMMWSKLDVKVNHAFAKGKLDKASISKVVAETSKILN